MLCVAQQIWAQRHSRPSRRTIIRPGPTPSIRRPLDLPDLPAHSLVRTCRAQPASHPTPSRCATPCRAPCRARHPPPRKAGGTAPPDRPLAWCRTSVTSPLLRRAKAKCIPRYKSATKLCKTRGACTAAAFLMPVLSYAMPLARRRPNTHTHTHTTPVNIYGDVGHKTGTHAPTATRTHASSSMRHAVRCASSADALPYVLCMQSLRAEEL